MPNFEDKIGRLSGQKPGWQDTAVRNLLTAVMHSHPTKKREQIAQEMSALLGRRVTLHMMNDFTRTSKEPSRFPAAWVRAFCEVTGDDRLQRLLLSDRLRALLELGERELQRETEERKQTKLRNRLLKESLPDDEGSVRT